MADEWQTTYRTLKQKHDEASKAIELAKNGEELENLDVALINYKLSIELIDDALATPVALPEDPDDVDDTWRLGLGIVQNLKRMRADVLGRIAILSPTPSMDECHGKIEKSTSSNRPRTFMELAEALQNIEYDAANIESLPSILELLFACEGVKLYHIDINGEVTTTDESSTLRIIRLDQDVVQKLDATYFLQIIHSSEAELIQGDDDLIEELDENSLESDDDVTPSAKKTRANTPPKPSDSSLIYPLVAGVSPCFRTEFGAFIFPDILSNIPGAAYGVVIPKTADEIVFEILEAILHGVVRQEPDQFHEIVEEAEELGEEGETKQRGRRYASERISDNIVQGACFISNGLVKGTEQVGKLVSYTTPYIISKLHKGPENAPVSNKVSGGVEVAKAATGVAVGVTGFVANKVGNATMALGRFLAPHVHAQGSKLLSKTMGYSTDEAQDKV